MNDIERAAITRKLKGCRDELRIAAQFIDTDCATFAALHHDELLKLNQLRCDRGDFAPDPVKVRAVERIWQSRQPAPE